jgi:ABC-type antimicrobial peptide transport system permease subunit
VVGDVRTHDLASPPRPDLYLPRSEDPNNFTWLIANIHGDPAALKNAVRSRLKKEFPEAEVSRYETMTEEMSAEVSQRTLLMEVAALFGLIALSLSILGTYGLLAYEVSLREKEIGIRLALGSSREHIVALLVTQEGRWLITGALFGLVSAIATGYALKARFYGSQSTSVPVLFGTTLLLLGPAFIAIALPARRASRLDPVQTLRRD